jgi:hypothetical protein
MGAKVAAIGESPGGYLDAGLQVGFKVMASRGIRGVN